MSELKKTIQSAVISAMKAGEKPRLGVIRLITSSIKQIEVDERIELDDTRIITVLDKMLKQRRESITQFSRAKRDDLVKQETFEIEIIQEFLPQALTEDEVTSIVTDAIEKTGASSIKEMGKVMGVVRPQVVGRANMGSVSAQIKSILTTG